MASEKPNRTYRTAKKEAQFLSHLSDCGNVSTACELSALARRTAYDLRARDSEFAVAWDTALDIGVDALIDEATRRAAAGVDEPVYYQGKVCGTVRRYSDTLLIFLLKGRRPELFKDRKEHTGADNKALFPEQEPWSDKEMLRRFLFMFEETRRGAGRREGAGADGAQVRGASN